MSTGRHRKTHDWMLTWLLVIMIAPWAGILSLKALQPTPAAFQPAPSHTVQPEPFVHPERSQPPSAGTKTMMVTVAQDDTLWSLAQKYCKNGNDWPKLAFASHIQSQVITIGEKIKIAC